jgi:hypothetical protein
MDELNDIFDLLAGSAAGVVPLSAATIEFHTAGVVPPSAMAAGAPPSDGTTTLPETAAGAVPSDGTTTLPETAAGAVPSDATTTLPETAGIVALSAATTLAQTAAGLAPAAASSSVLGTVLQSIAGAGSTANSSGGVGHKIETVALDVLKSGFGLVPILGGLLGLFGGGDDSGPPPTLTRYQMPEAIDYQGAEVGGRIANVDYDQAGAPRAFGGDTGAGTLPGITVNVQAMDARSFLDRSSDIAAAVKDAMLNLNSINDVVNDL